MVIGKRKINMYTDKHIADLDSFGLLSTALLMRRYRITYEEARAILVAIVQDYLNVEFRTPNQIFIIGREPDMWISEAKLSKKAHAKKAPKKSKWKDVTKP
jgi:hypothetical protein